jgi:hypothetical protein
MLSSSELNAFAGAIAALLGPNCRMEYGDDQVARIIDDEGRAVLLGQAEAKPGRVIISAQVPAEAARLGIEVKAITVAAGGGAAHAAAHIKRRLLPAHAAALRELETRRAAQPRKPLLPIPAAVPEAVVAAALVEERMKDTTKVLHTLSRARAAEPAPNTLTVPWAPMPDGERWDFAAVRQALTGRGLQKAISTARRGGK